MKDILIPKQLQVKSFRFVLLNGKIPFEKDWNTQNYRYNDPKLLKWIETGNNYGIVCGFGDLIGVDFDDEKIQNEVVPQLPPTFTVKSGGGLLHKYFKSNDTKSWKILDKESNTLVDIQGIGKQLVTVGSLHNSGNRYEVYDDIPITEIDIDVLKKLLLPYDPRELKEEKNNIKPPSDDVKLIKSVVNVPTLLTHYGISTTSNPTECPLHSSKKRQCLSFNDEVWKCFHCDRGGDIFTMVMEKEGCDFPGSIKYLTEKFNIKLPKKKLFKVKEEPNQIWELNDRGKRVINHRKVAMILIDKYHFITVGEEKHQIYFYEDGIYKLGGNRIILQEIQNKTKGVVTVRNNDVSEILGHIKRSTLKDREYLISSDRDEFCVGNGILNIKTRKLIEHDPKKIFTQKIEINFVPGAACPKIKKFLKDILQPEDVLIIQELFGYLLFRGYFIKKAIILVGETNTGKTTLLKLIIKFINEKNTSSLSLHKILTDRFASCGMEHKLLNFYDDLSFKDIKKTGAFKIATGDGYVSAEKKFGEHFSFMNYAKLVFATNKISSVEDNDDDAYFNRWIIIFFNNTFSPDDSKTNPNIINEITTKEELEGLLIFALNGLKRILERNKFSYNKTGEENKIMMERSSNIINVFFQDCLINTPGSWVSKNDLYKYYSKYVLHNGGSIVTKTKFTQEIQRKIPYTEETQKTVGKKRLRGWLNINYSTTFTTFLKLIYVKNNNTPKNNKTITKYIPNIHNNNFKLYNILKSSDSGVSNFVLEEMKSLLEMFKPLPFKDLLDKVSYKMKKEELIKILNYLKSEGLVCEGKPGMYDVM